MSKTFRGDEWAQKEYSQFHTSKGASCKNCEHWQPSSKRLGLCSDRVRKGYSDVWSRGNGTCSKFTKKKKSKKSRLKAKPT